MATIDEIKQQAEAVKNATQVGENTAERVGGALAGLAEIAKAQEDNIRKKADKEETNRLLAEKANTADVNSKFTEEKKRVDAELAKKFDKESVAQESGEAEDKVMSQKAVSDKLRDLSSVLDKASIKDEEGTVVETPFRYIQNEEFIFAKVDAEDRLLFGIQWDGTPKFGKTSAVEDRLQSQVNLLADKVTAILGDDDTTSAIDTLKELKDFFASIDNTQTLTSILANLNSISTKLGEDIKNLKDTKVDKEEGKSLIEDEVKERFRVIENEEFIKAVVDSEDRVLFGFYRATGEPYYPLNEMYHVIQNEEYFAAWVTTDDKIVLGLRRDGEIIGEIHAVNALKQVISQLQSDVAALQEKVGTIDTNIKELLDVFSLQENPEYLAVEKDEEGRILSATNSDGSHYIHNAKSETIPTEFEHIEDPDGRTEITTDSEDKVMSYRDADGKKHEHDMEITNLDVSNLNLKGNSVNNIQDALKANGFDVKTPIDWSESSFIQIPEPRFAIINITNIDSMPTTKTDNLHAWMEFWDMQGNYFKKRVIANAQGSSSMGFVKKNIAIDICNDEWIGDDTAKIRFGNLVPQDSFHIKAYYTDFFRGISVVSYHLYEQMQRTLGDMYDKPWKRALIDTDSITTTTKSLGSSFEGNMDLQTDTGALCHPDGFPIAVYLNGSFYGVFAMLIKKHRDNYHMNKSTAEHIHLDGTITNSTIFNGKDNINWSAFEIRNPKGLYAIGGNKYDADIKQEEIAGETEINSWIEVGKLPDGTAISSKIKKNLQLTAKVKKYIQNLADAIPNIKAAKDVYEASSKTEEDLNSFKSVYEKYFDSQAIIDYLVFTDTTNNTDGLSKNWQWITYNGAKWHVCVYDCDCTFGGHPLGNQIANVVNWHIHWSDYDTPEGYILKYYLQDMENRYAELSDKGIISSDNIIALVKDWMMRVGTTFYDEEYKKWSDSPCYSNSIVRNEYWELQVDSKGHALTDTSETFDARISYNIGDIVSFGLNDNMGYFKFKCIKQTVALSSNTAHAVSSYSPIKEFRHCDNIYRIEKWIEENIKSLDKLYHYTRK